MSGGESWKLSATVKGQWGPRHQIWWCGKCGESVLRDAPSCPSCNIRALEARLRQVASERDRLGEIADVFHLARMGKPHATAEGDRAARDLILMSQERWDAGGKGNE